MTTQVKPMTKDEIQAKIEAYQGQRAELETRLSELSKLSALSLVTGDSTAELDKERHQKAEEVRHIGDMIAGFEQAIKDAAKQEDEAKFRKALATLQETKPVKVELAARVEAARQALKQAEKELAAVDDQRTGAGRLREAYRDNLLKKHGVSQIEINLIEAEYKL